MDETKKDVNDHAGAESELNVGLGIKHDLYITGDKDAPETIKDRNGEVVLQLCKVCSKAESELRNSKCTPYPMPNMELTRLAVGQSGGAQRNES